MSRIIKYSQNAFIRYPHKKGLHTDNFGVTEFTCSYNLNFPFLIVDLYGFFKDLKVLTNFDVTSIS